MRSTYSRPKNSYFFHAILLLIVFCSTLTQLKATDEIKDCIEKSPLQILLLFDLTPENVTVFQNQQNKVIRTLRHLDVVAGGRDRSYGLIGFNHQPFIISPLNATDAGNVTKSIEVVENLRARKNQGDASPAKALDTAGEHIVGVNAGRRINDIKTIIILVHDGHNTDLIAETLEATAKLADIRSDIFAISGSDSPNLAALIGYAHARSHVFTSLEESVPFFEAINKKIGVCFEQDDMPSKRVNSPIDPSKLLTNVQRDFWQECNPSTKIDLMLALDTSGSEFNSFLQERQLAIDLIESLDEEVFQSKIQVGLLRFAANSSIEISLKSPQTKNNILKTINAVEITDKDTQISDAIEAALKHLQEFRRDDAQQIFILISDGHGQEYWHKAKSVGQQLRQSGAQIFAVSASSDYNLAELELYAGRTVDLETNKEQNIFVGARHKQFVSTLSKYIKKCLNVSQTFASTNETTSDPANSDQFLGEKRKIGEIIVENVTKSESTDVIEGKQASDEIDLKQSFDSPQLTSDEEEIERIFRTLSIYQNSTRVPDECLTDVIFVIDRAEFSTNKNDNFFVKQLELISGLVEKIDSTDIESGKVRLAAISFNKEAKLHIGFSENANKIRFLDTLKGIQPLAKHSSFLNAIKATLKEVSLGRRPEARLLVIVAWSGTNGLNNDQELSKDAKELSKLPFSEVFVVTLNPKNQLNRLKAVAGDKWNVFVDGRVQQFLQQTSFSLLTCTLPPLRKNKSLQLKTQNPISKTLNILQKVEKLQLAAKAFQKPKSCDNDTLDLLIVLDISSSKPGVSDRLKKVAIDLLKQAPVEDYRDRVRVALITQDREAKMTSRISLEKNTPRDDILFSIDRMDSGIGKFALDKAILEALRNAANFARPNTRLALIVISNGDNFPTEKISIDKAAVREALAKIPPKTIKLAVSGDAEGIESLKSYFNDDSMAQQIFNSKRQNDYQRFLVRSRFQIFECLRQKRLSEIASKAALFEFSDSIVKEEPPLDGSSNLKLVKKPNSTIDEEKANASLNSTLLDPLKVSSTSSDSLKSEAVEPSKTIAHIGTSLLNDELKASTLSMLTSFNNDVNETETASKNAIETTARNPEGPLNATLGAITRILEKSSENLNQTEEIKELPKVENSTVSLNNTNSDSIFTESTTTSITMNLINSTVRDTIPTLRESLPTTKILAESVPKVSFFNDECKVDLIFIIDTSQSVAREFQKQLQFAVDLVKRLPDEDFAQRVQVAAVSFYKTATIQFGFGELHEKTAVLDALFNISHTGGGTSVVSGVELAIAEIARGRRPTEEARLMVVLISDGNSQDPWERVVDVANSLRRIKADVYAVTVSHDYFFRELELYAGNKWFVYIDARIRQFLDEAETSIIECKGPTIPMATTPLAEEITFTDSPLLSSTISGLSATTILSPSSSIAPIALFKSRAEKCEDDFVDLLFILDTSTSVEKDFYAEKNFALDLIKVLPEADFEKRISIALVKFSGNASLQFGFQRSSGVTPKSRNDVLYEMERVEHTGGQTSLVSGTSEAIVEISDAHRAKARLVVVIISDGNSQDEWPEVQKAAKALRSAAGDNAQIYAVTLSVKYYFDELKEYTGNESNIYTDERVDQFIQAVGQSIVHCSGKPDSQLHMTMAPNVEVSVTPPSSTHLSILRNSNNSLSKGKTQVGTEFARDEEPIREVVSQSPKHDSDAPQKVESGKCKYSKMDLIIILDASSSRESVFEHQRELALSLIERLPISADDTHVATGINSFTNVPTLRQTLGLGRDRKMVRKAIEEIKYHGGSTLTSKAIELAVQDLEHGRRPDAIQVVVLMNDGMSQDLWEKVLSASAALAATGAERFGVALGSEVDLRELRHYIGNEERIYRDGSTERFLNDVVSLLNGNAEKDCPGQSPTTSDNGFEFQVDDACEKPQLDLIVLFDNSDNTPNMTDSKLNSNRYLLLDVLGSLPLKDQVHLAVVSFGEEPKLEHKFTDSQDRESVFERIEGIKPKPGKASYSKAVLKALDYYKTNHRSSARGLFLIVGNGVSSGDQSEYRSLASNSIRKTKGLTSYALDSGKVVDEQTLSAYTGSKQRVYNYDRNAEFAKVLLTLATAGTDDRCHQTGNVKTEESIVGQAQNDEVVYSTPKALLEKIIVKQQEDSEPQRQRDIGIAGQGKSNDDEAFGIENEQKVVVQQLGGEKKFATVRPISVQVTESPATTTEKRISKSREKLPQQLKTILREQIQENSSPPPQNNNKQQENTILAKGGNEEQKLQQNIINSEQHDSFSASSTTKIPSILEKIEQPKQKLFKTVNAESVFTDPFALSNIQERNRLKNSTTTRLRTRFSTTTRPRTTKTTTISATTTRKSASTKRNLFSSTTTLAPIIPTSQRATTTKDVSRQTGRVLTTSTTNVPLASLINKAKTQQVEIYKPGCLVDLLLLIDSSGSVEATFQREKELAAGIISKLRIGSRNARVALIKFAASDKVRTLYSFDRPQNLTKILRLLDEIQLSSGTTAIDSALLQAITEYTPLKGARPGLAQPLAIIFTDGFGQHDSSKEAVLLRRIVPEVYAVAVNHEFPISRLELERITGDPTRVFTDSNINKLHALLRTKFQNC